MIAIDRELCIGCGQCVQSCLAGVIRVEDGIAVAGEACIHCGSCVGACPANAITMEEKEDRKESDFSAYKGICVVSERDRISGRPLRVVYELLSKARELSDITKEEVWLLDLCRDFTDADRKEAGSVGCDRIFVVKGEEYACYQSELFSKVVTEFVTGRKPSVVLFPGTEDGRDLAPCVSTRLKVGLTADCTDLLINEKGELVQVRPTYGGSVIASIITPDHRPQMASVRGNVFAVKKTEKTTDPETEDYKPDLSGFAAKIVKEEFRARKAAYQDIEEAEILITAGYGTGKEGMKLIFDLAEALGAAVGVTRKVVDEGWAPAELQIGQTGKVAAPELYISFGVSGALQHTIGIRNAKRIIAVNHDANAQIFKMADVPVFGDCKDVLKEMIAAVRENK